MNRFILLPLEIQIYILEKLDLDFFIDLFIKDPKLHLITKKNYFPNSKLLREYFLTIKCESIDLHLLFLKLKIDPLIHSISSRSLFTRRLTLIKNHYFENIFIDKVLFGHISYFNNGDVIYKEGFSKEEYKQLADKQNKYQCVIELPECLNNNQLETDNKGIVSYKSKIIESCWKKQIPINVCDVIKGYDIYTEDTLDEVSIVLADKYKIILPYSQIEKNIYRIFLNYFPTISILFSSIHIHLIITNYTNPPYFYPYRGYIPLELRRVLTNRHIIYRLENRYFTIGSGFILSEIKKSDEMRFNINV